MRLATIIGTFQSTLTDFRYLRSVWKKNAEEERLLGVSLTGIMDHPVLSKVSDESVEWLKEMKQVVYDTNDLWAEKLGIEKSAALSTGKPSGTVSELVDSSSGIHPRFSHYYVRTVRADIKDPLAQLMKEQGVPCEPDVTNPNSTVVFSFPKSAPHSSVQRKEITAIDQLNHYKMFRDNWCDHNMSITVYVKPDEWLDVGSWVYKNWDAIGGISFLPYSDHIYRQAPFTEITDDEYEQMSDNFPTIDFSVLHEYESTDQTAGQKEFACVSGACELI